VITRDQVDRAKPDPDLFLAAAKGLGVPIHQSIVVGDSVWDLLAARRANALGVGLLRTSSVEPAPIASIKILPTCCGI